MTKIMITLRQILENRPILFDRMIQAHGNEGADLDKHFPVSSILESGGLEDTLLALPCLPNHGALWKKFAWWCATKCVDDDHTAHVVKECLTVIDRFLNGESTLEELLNSRDATWDESSNSAAKCVRYASKSASYDDGVSAAIAAARAASFAVESNAAAAMHKDRSIDWSAAWSAAESAQAAKLKQILDAGEWV